MKQVNKPINKDDSFWAQEFLDVLVNGYNEKMAKNKPSRKEILEKELQNKQK